MNQLPPMNLNSISSGSQSILDIISKSPIMIGLAVLMINLSGRYLAADISQYDEKVLNNKFMKKLTIFSIAFLSTRDIKYSIIIVLLYSLLFNPCGLAYKIMSKTQGFIRNPIQWNNTLHSDLFVPKNQLLDMGSLEINRGNKNSCIKITKIKL
jgi:uncharacterized membrane protein